MHVLMTADAVGGVWTYALELCRQLDARGVDVTLAVMGPQPSPSQRDEIGRLRRVTLHGRPYRLEWMDDPWEDVAAAGEWLLSLERQVQPDVVHLNGYCHGASPWQAPVVMVGHSCVLSWWRAVRGQLAPATWDRYAKEVTRGLHAADAVVAPTVTMLRWLEEFYGPLAHGRTIPNGRSMTVEAPANNEPLILTAGRLWDEAKNVAAICDVAADVDWPVVIAGSVGEERIRPTTRARYLGPLPSEVLQHWMTRASIYVLPARYEPFGLSVLEAALAGCALVLGDIPTLREIWHDAAVFVASDDRGALRAALANLIHDGHRRNTLATAARRRAAALTPQRMADGYCALYAELMSERHSLLSLSAV
jgi:glycosyltransferase involved in cell wall biosynthesis